MRKVLRNNKIYFYDDNNFEIMYIDYSTDECIWMFNTSDVIRITPDMEMFSLLDEFMNQEYMFDENVLQDYKDNNKLVWYSDCCYDPDDDWSVASVSCLNIEKKDGNFDVWCTKKIDEIIDRPNKFYGICFSPLGNGKYSKNLNTGLTLQDDFVICVYQQLLAKTKKRVLK